MEEEKKTATSLLETFDILQDIIVDKKVPDEKSSVVTTSSFQASMEKINTDDMSSHTFNFRNGYGFKLPDSLVLFPNETERPDVVSLQV